MIGIDTNLLVRMFAAEDERQRARAAMLLDGATGAQGVHICIVVLVEFAWTMRRAYKWRSEDVRLAIASILDHANVVAEQHEAVREALNTSYQYGLDFPDCLISAANKEVGCSTTFTFDRDAARFNGFTLLETSQSSEMAPTRDY